MRYKSLEITEFYENFYVCKASRGSNIGLFVKDQRALVIDSGYYPDTAYDVISFLENVLEAEPALLFNTHYHSDHTFGNQVFKCPILSSGQCKTRMEEGLTSFWSAREIELARAQDPYLAKEWRNLQITIPTLTFDDKYVRSFEGERIIFERLGGHTPGTSVAYFPRHHIVFAGDLVYSGIYPTLLRDGDPFELIDALPLIKPMSIDRFVPGHGSVCAEDIVDSLEDYWRCLINECWKGIDLGLGEETVIEEVYTRCRLRDIEFNESRHRRNIDSVLSSVKSKAFTQ